MQENNEGNLVDFGKEVVDKLCLLIIVIGISRGVQLDKIKINIKNKTKYISCKDFDMKYEEYARQIEENKSYQLIGAEH